MIDSWDRLRVFAAVARHGSVAAAATELHLTGPGVSHHVRQLERSLGVELVEPYGRGIRLTAAGQVLARHAQAAGTSVADALAEVEAMRTRISGPVRLGGSAGALRALASSLGDFCRAHPGVELSVLDDDTVELLPRLAGNELDVVVAESWSSLPRPPRSGLVEEVLLTEEVWLALPPGHPTAGAEHVTAAELSGQTWVSCLSGSDPYLALQAWTAEQGQPSPTIAHQVQDFRTALAFVREGLAVALVTELARLDAPDQVVFRAVAPRVTRTLSVVRPDRAARPAESALVQALRL